MKAQEELNTILLAKIHNEEKYKNEDFDKQLLETAPYNKCKGRKLEFSIHSAKTSSEESDKQHKKNSRFK